jgi:hypothetical protein
MSLTTIIKPNFIILTLLIVLCFSVSSQKKMGFEVETRTIKVNNDADHSIDFLVWTRPDRRLLLVESDTIDNPQEELENLEIKTIGGHGNNVIGLFARRTQELLINLFNRTQNNPLDITANLSVGGRTWHYIGPIVGTRIQRGANAHTRVVRPQITYQIDLADMDRLFAKLNFFKPNIVNGFDNFVQQRNLTPPNHYSAKVKGLIKLFNFYLYRLFSQSTANQGDLGNWSRSLEPGPKSLLSIMSRISFKKMYSGLSDAEKQNFRYFFRDRIHGTILSRKKIKIYSCFDRDNGRCSHRINPRYGTIDYYLREAFRITLTEWYNSNIGVGITDILHPPVGTYNGYGMGGLNAIHVPNGYALVEARFYANRYNHLNYRPTIDNVYQILNSQKRWFFQ